MATLAVTRKGKTASVETNAYLTDTSQADWTEDDTRTFYRAGQWLSNYALSCGYRESAEGFVLYLDGCYHVQGLGFWESFDTYTEARKFFVRAVKESLRFSLMD